MSLIREELDELTALSLRPAVSVLMPTHHAGPAIRQDPIRLKNLVREVEHQLDGLGLAREDVARITGPAHELIDDRAFWRHQDHGLAVYAAPNFFRAFRVARPLTELAVASQRFHVTQLFPEIAEGGRFHVLALSQKDVRLIDATRTTGTSVDLGDLPRNIPDALLSDTPEQELQPHVVNVVGGQRGVAFHGHGPGLDERKEAIRQFCHRVDRGLRTFLPAGPSPLVLAAVDYLVPLYRDTNSHPGLLPEAILGNPEPDSADMLASKGWEIVRRHLEATEAAAVDRYSERLGQARASSDLATVLRATHEGRVDELFVAAGVERWGTFEADSAVVTLADGPGAVAEDLLNLAAIQAYQRGGRIHVVDRGRVPGGGDIAATFRY